MTVLLDTCALLWWWADPGQLSPKALTLLKDPSNKIFVSSATAWEIATKTRRGKLPQGPVMLEDWEKRMTEDGFAELSITSLHAKKAGLLAGDHRDPFDRMIAAQSLLTGLPVVTSDPEIGNLGTSVLW